MEITTLIFVHRNKHVRLIFFIIRFVSAYTPRDYPVEVKLRQNLNFQASVKSKDKALSVLAENCYSTPSQDKKDGFKYYLIVDGLVCNI